MSRIATGLAILVTLCIIFYSGAMQYVAWRNFPDSYRLSLEEMQQELGIPSCSVLDLTNDAVSQKKIDACFRVAKLEAASVQPGPERTDMALFTYRCAAGGIYGKASYVMFRSGSGAYECRAAVSLDEKALAGVDTTGMAIIPAKPGWLLKLFLMIFGQ